MAFKVLLLLSAFVAASYAHPSGAPQETCEIFSAKHDNYKPQNSKAPYHLRVSPSSINSGSKVTVTIEAAGPDRFRGFFVQGQDSKTKQPIGTFKAQLDAQTRDCSTSSDSVTHVNKDLKTKITLEWTAPPSFIGSVAFRAVIVQKHETFWNNVQSNTLTVS